MEPLAIVIPLRDFADGKSRLRHAGVSDVEQRIEELATGVINASHPRPTYVACESSRVAAFARVRGARVILSDVHDLNAAVTNAHGILAKDFRTIVIVLGDLRNPAGLGAYEPPAPVSIVADHHGTGTNVLAVPGGVEFVYSFGPDSARHHAEEAARLGLSCHVTYDSEWAYDVDEIEDLRELLHLRGSRDPLNATSPMGDTR